MFPNAHDSYTIRVSTHSHQLNKKKITMRLFRSNYPRFQYEYAVSRMTNDSWWDLRGIMMHDEQKLKPTANHVLQCSICVSTIMLRCEFQRGYIHVQAPIRTLRTGCYDAHKPPHCMRCIWNIYNDMSAPFLATAGSKGRVSCFRGAGSSPDHHPSGALQGSSANKCTNWWLEYVIYGVSFFWRRLSLVCDQLRARKSRISRRDSSHKFPIPRRRSVITFDHVIRSAREWYR